MDEKILTELRELKSLSLLAAKNILGVSDLALLLGLSEKTIRNNIERYPHYKDAQGRVWFKRDEIEQSLCLIKCYHNGN